MKNRIKELRKSKGLTLKQLGEKLDMKNNTLSQYETGKREPKIETWRKLADFFGTTVSYLQGEDTVLKARDLFFEISILADLYPGLHDQLKAIEDENNLYFGYENLHKEQAR